MAQHCQKYASSGKKLKIKVFGIEFRLKKSASAYVYLLPEWSQGARKNLIPKNSYLELFSM